MEGSEVRGLLQPLLLLLIIERPGHGYDLIERLDRLGAGGVEPGQVYRVLRGLEREGLVVSSWIPPASGPARRRYEPTAEGFAALEARMARLARLGAVLDSCLTRWDEAVKGGRDGAVAGGARAPDDSGACAGR
ncbi:PadR family transcriptional regulator [Thermomonospora umbrina]|uniref:DNA-binding PadR family transcriptional regulator n=1 Tax=Thermomonospora umbrina TaxID=111806 RepID=A0A3D9SP93_9ACTN|nr:helix-turn-helix transcriptional regulator [Thermomonospora umbrina]REE97782.1 DNA-binding PadR family transcriptional regulator [Thermomonospora umbrina]